MLFALIVMPRSRSRSMESSTCSCISRSESAPVISSKRSASVDLPWSMCAMMQKFRMNCGSMCLDYGLVPFQLDWLILHNPVLPAKSWNAAAFAIAFTVFNYRQEPLLLRTFRHTRAETLPSNTQFAINLWLMQPQGEVKRSLFAEDADG